MKQEVGLRVTDTGEEVKEKNGVLETMLRTFVLYCKNNGKSLKQLSGIIL